MITTPLKSPTLTTPDRTVSSLSLSRSDATTMAVDPDPDVGAHQQPVVQPERPNFFDRLKARKALIAQVWKEQANVAAAARRDATVQATQADMETRLQAMETRLGAWNRRFDARLATFLAEVANERAERKAEVAKLRRSELSIATMKFVIDQLGYVSAQQKRGDLATMEEALVEFEEQLAATKEEGEGEEKARSRKTY
ncbi:hypothetical protein B0H12DRAFT_1231636 [Mycena haematopus]|nr:hypothetical protein B0H12DRAFT_1231636 [Mycena haematopus]